MSSLSVGSVWTLRIAWHGPFVASDKRELQLAFRAYQDGSFPPKRVPWNYRKAAAAPRLGLET